jgi:hypothetical protein
VGGEWAEVKTLAVGAVRQEWMGDEWKVHTGELSYFPRLADAFTFGRLSCESCIVMGQIGRQSYAP